MKLWQRHLLSRLAQTFLFVVLALFFVFVLVDLSVHGIRFISFGKASLLEIFLYYLRTFAAFLDLFLTLAFLLATLRVLFDLRVHRELVALQMAGLSKKQLLVPFFLFAALLSTACYINSQWFAPDAQDITQAFLVASKPKKNQTKAVRVQSLSLEDDSELIYQSFDPEKNELFDLFWVRSPNDIWHMKYFEVGTLKGRFVNHFTRNDKRQLEKTESFREKAFLDLPWNPEAILHKFVPFENRSLSTLFLQAFNISAERPSVLTHLYYKLLIPLIPFLVLFAIGPISLAFARHHPFFLIAACSLFGFISLKVILDGMLILGENQVLPAAIAVFGPVFLYLTLTVPPFVRMR